MVSDVLRNKWVQAVGLLGVIIAISVVLYLLSSVLVPLFFAFIVAYVFDPVIDRIERFKVKGRHVSRVAAIVTLVGGIVLAALLLPLMVLPGVLNQAREMMKPPAVSSAHASEGASMSAAETGGEPSTPVETPLGDRLASGLEDWLGLDNLAVMLKLAGPEEEDPHSLALIRAWVGTWVNNNVGQLVQGLFPQFKAASTSVVKLLGLLGDTFLRVFLFIGNFVLFAFVAIYLLKDYDHIVASGDDLVPHRYRAKTREIMKSIDRQLRSFLRGQFTVCCCLGAMYAIGFTLSGTPFALPLALFGALASFVPYLGLILTIGPAVILTVLYHSGMEGNLAAHLAGVLATFAVAQFLEGNVLTPRIVGSQVGLGPVWVILAIMVFSSTLGFAGLLLAVPIAAVLKVLAGEALAIYRASALFSGSDDDGAPPSDSITSKGRKTGPSSAGKGRRLKKG